LYGRTFVRCLLVVVLNSVLSGYYSEFTAVACTIVLVSVKMYDIVPSRGPAFDSIVCSCTAVDLLVQLAVVLNLAVHSHYI